MFTINIPFLQIHNEHSAGTNDTVDQSNTSGSECSADTASHADTSGSTGRHDSRDIDILLKSVASGSRDSFSKLYEVTKNSVFGFALSFLKDPHSAEDIMHDAYIRIWTSAGSYVSSGKPMAWILTIVRNLCLMHIRGAKKSSGIEIDDLRNYLSVNPDTSIEDRDLLVAAFNVLSEDEVQIVMLHAVSGFKHKEISDVLEIPQATVITKYRRALKKLKMYLEEVSK